MRSASARTGHVARQAVDFEHHVALACGLPRLFLGTRQRIRQDTLLVLRAGQLALRLRAHLRGLLLGPCHLAEGLDRLPPGRGGPRGRLRAHAPVFPGPVRGVREVRLKGGRAHCLLVPCQIEALHLGGVLRLGRGVLRLGQGRLHRRVPAVAEQGKSLTDGIGGKVGQAAERPHLLAAGRPDRQDAEAMSMQELEGRILAAELGP